MNRNSALRVAACVVAMIVPASTLAAQIETFSPFGKLDRIEDSWINRNPVPYRPMVAMADGTIFAVNPYLSEVVHIKKDPLLFKFSIPASSSTWNGRFRTLPGPVSIARYQPPDPDGGGPLPLPNEQLLVVCQHANTLAIHDAVTGDLLGTVRVPSAPGDIVVDQTNARAWVSCPLADKVSAIDLAARTVLKNFDTSKFSRSPGFLTLYTAAGRTEVLVSPRISGNGSLVDRKDFPDALAEKPNGPTGPPEEFDEHAGPRGILDTLLPSIADVGLPDHDLLWLDSTTLGNPLGGVTPIAKSTGTILFASAIKPGTTTLWQLNLDSNNKDATLQSEPAVRGQIVFNRVTKIQLPTSWSGVPEVQPTESRYIDSTTGATSVAQINYAAPNVAVATPYSLAFSTTGNLCAVTGLMSDNVIFLTGAGNRVGANNGTFELKEIPQDTDNEPTAVDENTMPRQVLMSGNTLLAVWGGNLTAHFVDISVSPASHYWLRLGYDPTPALVKEGRKTFFDGSHSLHGNASCASCHDEGKSDMLAWNLSNIDASSHDGNDNKGPMVTQTLLNISRALPFHWRGEQRRGLADFNPAFENLLGGTRLTGVTLLPADGVSIDPPDGQWAGFQAFVLSLTEDANQFEHETRRVSSFIKIPTDDPLDRPATGISIDPIHGQGLFLQTCVSCHMLPTATNNEVVDNVFGGDPNPDRLWLKIAPFQGMQNKAKQALVKVTFPAGTRKVDDDQIYPILGTGLSHAGVVRDSIPFMQVLLFDNPLASPPITYKDRLDTASFLYQFDTGIPPAAERMVYFDSGTFSDLTTKLAYFLGSPIGQATVAKHNCDLAVIGKLKKNDPTAPFYGWVYDAAQNKYFGPDSSGQGDAGQTLDFFSTAVGDSDGAWFAFIGLPVGTAWRFAADFDGDGLPNQLETQNGLNMFNPDTDGNGVWDGPQVTGGQPAAIHFDGDTTPEVVGSTPDFQWVTLTTGRMTFETDEIAIARLTLTPNPSGPPIIVLTEDGAKMHHNLLVTSLVYPTVYTVKLELANQESPGVWNLVTPAPPTLDMSARVPGGPRTPTSQALKVTSLSSASSFPQKQGSTGQVWKFRYQMTVGDRASSPVSAVWVATRPLIDGKTVTAAGVPFTAYQGSTGHAAQPSLDFEVNSITDTPTVGATARFPYTPTGFTFSLSPPPIDNYPSQPVTLPGVIPGPFAIGFNPDPGVSTFDPTGPAGAFAGRCDVEFTLDLTGKLVNGTQVTLCIEAMGAKTDPAPLPAGAPNAINMLGKSSFGIFTDQTDAHTGGGPFIPSFFGPPHTSDENRALNLWWWSSDSLWHASAP